MNKIESISQSIILFKFKPSCFVSKTIVNGIFDLRFSYLNNKHPNLKLFLTLSLYIHSSFTFLRTISNNWCLNGTYKSIWYSETFDNETGLSNYVNEKTVKTIFLPCNFCSFSLILRWSWHWYRTWTVFSCNKKWTMHHYLQNSQLYSEHGIQM